MLDISDEFQTENTLLQLLEMTDEEALQEKENFIKLFQLAISKDSINERLIQMRNLGITIEDLAEENEKLRNSILGEDIELSDVKKELMNTIINMSIDANNQVIAQGMRAHVTVPFQFCRDSAFPPEYANDGDAGMDFFAAEDVVVMPGETKVIGTGIKMAIPEGYELQIRPRSGWTLKKENQNVCIPNSPGTIDSGYRDEIGIILRNTGEMGFAVVKGARIVQGVLMPVPKAVLELVDDVSAIGNNRGGGFGSTGV